LTFTEMERALEGEECVAGLDLSTTTDLAALVLAFQRSIEPGQPGYPTEEEVYGENPTVVIPGFEFGDPLKTYDLLSYFWCPQEGIRVRSRRDRAPYDIWEKEGFLTATEGDAVDHQAIRLAITELGKRYYIREIAADAWNAHKILTELQNDDGFLVSRIRQGFLSLSAPTKELDLLYLRRRIRHAGHPVLRWCANNAALEKDAADNWKPSKKKSKERIDGISALVTALARLIVEQESDGNRRLQSIG
jgi:phage terminase large subunit-like protein